MQVHRFLTYDVWVVSSWPIAFFVFGRCLLAPYLRYKDSDYFRHFHLFQIKCVIYLVIIFFLVGFVGV